MQLKRDDDARQLGALTVTVRRAFHLEPMDRSGTSDAYAAVTIGRHRACSTAKRAMVKDKTLNPSWDEVYGHDYIGHNYVGHNYIGAITT